MRKLYILLSLLFLCFCSCDDEFTPKTDFEEKYVLFGVITNSPQLPSTSLQVTVLSTYDIEGFNPVVDHTDHSIPGCIVTLTINDKDYHLSQDTVKKVTSTFKTKYSYKINSFPIPADKELKIKAQLPNGKILTAKTKVPETLSILEFSYPFNSGVHTKLNRFIWGDKWVINWDSYNDYLYFPRLKLYYQVKSSTGLKHYSREIPLKYVKKNDKYEPVYPSYTYDKQMEYSYDCIDSVMSQISAGDTAKSTYIIGSISFGMLEYEHNLASYFSSTNGYLDNFSIRLDESVYSNVSGGIGVFGAYTVSSQTFKVERAYVESFGYTWREP